MLGPAAPVRLATRLVALLGACVAADAGSRLFASVLSAPPVSTGADLLALAVLLPGLTLSFLAGLWLLRSLQSLPTG